MIKRHEAIDHRVRHDCRRDDQIAESATRHDFCFAERRTADAQGAGPICGRAIAIDFAPLLWGRNPMPWALARDAMAAMLRSSASISSSKPGVLNHRRAPSTPMNFAFGPSPFDKMSDIACPCIL
jgi:hypothetical protein